MAKGKKLRFRGQKLTASCRTRTYNPLIKSQQSPPPETKPKPRPEQGLSSSAQSLQKEGAAKGAAVGSGDRNPAREAALGRIIALLANGTDGFLIALGDQLALQGEPGEPHLRLVGLDDEQNGPG